MDESEIAALVEFGEAVGGSVKAEIDTRIGTVAERMAGIGAVGGNAQIGDARGDKVGIIGWRDEMQPVAAAAQMHDDEKPAIRSRSRETEPANAGREQERGARQQAAAKDRASARRHASPSHAVWNAGAIAESAAMRAMRCITSGRCGSPSG